MQQGRLLVALLIAALVVVAGLMTSPWGRDVSDLSGDEISVRVVDPRREAVRGAQVLLFAKGRYRAVTDTFGFAALSLPKSMPPESLLVVQSDEFQIYEENLSPGPRGHLEIQLSSRETESGRVLLRIVEAASGEGVPNAEVQLIQGADGYSQQSDSRGFVKFDLDFHDEKTEASITVNALSYRFERRLLTLRPDTVQDIVLDRQKRQLELGPG